LGGGGGGGIIVPSSCNTGAIASSTQLAALTAMISTKTYFKNFIFQMDFVVEHSPAQSPRMTKRSQPKHYFSVVSQHALNGCAGFFFGPRVGRLSCNVHQSTTRESSQMNNHTQAIDRL